MKTYRVTVAERWFRYHELEIVAEDEDHAEELAVERVDAMPFDAESLEYDDTEVISVQWREPDDEEG